MQKWMAKVAKIDIGLNMKDRGDHEGAIKYFSDLIEKHPDDEELYFWRGQVYRSAGRALEQVSKSYTSERAEVYTPDQSKEYFQKSIEDLDRSFELHGWDNKKDSTE